MFTIETYDIMFGELLWKVQPVEPPKEHPPPPQSEGSETSESSNISDLEGSSADDNTIEECIVEEKEEEWFEMYEEEEEDDVSYNGTIYYDETYEDYDDRTSTKRNKKKNKQEKISSTHKFINSNHQRRQAEKEAIEEFYIDLTKTNASVKTNYARHYPAFGPNNLRGLERHRSRKESTDRQRETHTKTNYQDDADLRRAIQQSKKMIQKANKLSNRQADILAELQNRDLTPEDYEILLLLDESVPKKTISEKDIERLPHRHVEVEEGSCVVCMCDYAEGEEMTKLPCGHEFHTRCITMWLTMSSVNCPSDNLPVEL
ncbi:RING zinc finger-containing protein [Planoprotostelium fungivorum]|uniref:RING zinc finger-containing protein n=1 Tax=Planoprotostelium fungivorum TaxID=1890364 RepID=A0A2P6NPA3_9EUKA|nr:RING zinc finger-containing protein [Planoprotostelium fungivorum]